MDNIYNINNNIKLVLLKFLQFLISSNKIYCFSSIVIIFFSNLLIIIITIINNNCYYIFSNLLFFSAGVCRPQAQIRRPRQTQPRGSADPGVQVCTQRALLQTDRRHVALVCYLGEQVCRLVCLSLQPGVRVWPWRSRHDSPNARCLQPRSYSLTMPRQNQN